MSEDQQAQNGSTGKLAKALTQARLAVPWFVTKGGFNSHQRYPFVGHPDVMAHEGRRALSEQGLALVQTLVECVGELPGGKQSVLLWRGQYQLLHESGERLGLTLSATTQAGDKAAFVASTALDRTCWIRLLALAGSDDEDPDHTGPQQPGAQAAPPEQKAAAQAQKRDGAQPNGQGGQYGQPAQPTATQVTLNKLIADLAAATQAGMQALVDSANALRPALGGPERESLRAAIEQARGRISRQAAQPQAQGGAK